VQTSKILYTIKRVITNYKTNTGFNF